MGSYSIMRSQSDTAEGHQFKKKGYREIYPFLKMVFWIPLLKKYALHSCKSIPALRGAISIRKHLEVTAVLCT